MKIKVETNLEQVMIVVIREAQSNGSWEEVYISPMEYEGVVCHIGS